MASSRSRRRQSRLAFTPLPSSSPAAKGYNKQIQDRAAAVTLENSPSSAKRRKYTHFDGANDNLPTPVASHQRVIEEVGEDSESEPVQPSQRRMSTQSRQRSRQQRLDFSNVRDADSFSPKMKLSSPARPQSSARGMFGTQRKGSTSDNSSDNDSVEELSSLRNRAGSGKSKVTNMGGKRASQAIRVQSDSDDNIVVNSGSTQAQSETVEVESEDDDDDMPTTAGTQRRKRARRKSHDSFISSSPPAMIDSDDDLEIIEQPSRRRRRRMSSDSEEQSEEEPITPSRKLKQKRQLSEREQEDLAEDLNFLEPSSDIESPRQKRDTQSQRKNARKSALEQLKRRRSKQVDEVEDADESVEEQPAPLKSSQMFREDEYDEGFVEEEDDEPLGVPEGVPLEFTRYASMKAKELFKHAVEWFVQKKINPAFSMNDPIYDLTFKKLDDEVAGLAGSKFKSSVWRPEFTLALNARPEIAFEPIDRNEADHWMRDHCDACNRSNHPATYQIQFQGKPYYRETLENVAGNDDEDDSSSEDDDRDDDEPTYDAAGREIAPESKTYYVGKFCMSNAQTAHALQHWRYHLNQWVVTWLDRNGYNEPSKVVRRDGWSTKKRRKYANKIVDELEEQGLVKQLYQDYKKNIDEARNSKQGRYDGWD